MDPTEKATYNANAQKQKRLIAVYVGGILKMSSNMISLPGFHRRMHKIRISPLKTGSVNLSLWQFQNSFELSKLVLSQLVPVAPRHNRSARLKIVLMHKQGMRAVLLLPLSVRGRVQFVGQRQLIRSATFQLLERCQYPKG